MKTQNYIGGEWTDSPETIANINPSDVSDTIGRFAQADVAQLNRAVAAARDAQPKWQSCGLEKRRALLSAVGGELMSRADSLGELLSREEGKPRAEGVGEVYRAGQFFDYYAAEVLRAPGETADSVRPNIEIDVRREPVGVVGIISPWNFPMATACWKIAPALAFGNSVVWKPANLTPASATALAEIFAKHNAPPGVFNLTIGGGECIGEGLAGHSEIDALSFTGSLETGRKIASAAAANLTKVQLEMGSKNPLVIMDDADIDLAVRHAAAGAFGGTGQKCTASSRLIVHRKVLSEFADKLVAATKAIKTGHALEEGTQMGPAASEMQMQGNLRYMQIAKEENADHLCGGEELRLAHDGFYMSPALFAGDNAMRINREEMFAPIACIIAADSYEHALHIAGDTEYGLVAGLMTRSLSRASHFRRNMKAGCIMINLPTAGTDYHVPFGGRKNSSHGAREQGRAAAEFYTALKTAYIFAGEPE